MHDYISDIIRQSYADCLCPDCQEEIPVDVFDGDECSNCGHVFFAPADVDA